MKKPFNPNLLPVNLEQREIIEILKREVEARTVLERLNSLLERSVIKNLILMIFSMDESIQSTKIEGTQATFSEMMEYGVTGKRTEDTQEVTNYLKAIDFGYELLQRMPISTRMFHQLHEIILENSRGQNRSPGQFRKIQNFIGPTSKIEDASYIPPEPQTIDALISNLEKYINDEFNDDFGRIARAAIIHAQFETIHPYLDGNGRLGRILIILYLISSGVIKSPTFFVSEELEKSKFKYYGLLNNLRSDLPKWKDWIVYFIDSSVKQAEYYISKLVAIENLYSEICDFAVTRNVSTNVVSVIFKRPFFMIKHIQEEAGVSYNTAKKYVDILVESGRIYSDDKKKNRIYRFYDLIDIMR